MNFLKRIIFFIFLVSCSLAHAEDDVTVGFIFENPVTTFKIQSFSGKWDITFHPFKKDTPSAILTERLYGKANYTEIKEILMPGEDLAIILAGKGIVAKVSSEKEIDYGFEGLTITGGQILSVEMPNHLPLALEGKIEIFRDGLNRLNMINTVSQEQFVVSTVSLFGKMSSEIEAIKAYIIAARSKLKYLLTHKQHKDSGYDICNTYHCLPFEGCGKNRELVYLLAEQTKGQILTYDGNPINARFHDTCGGKVSSAKDVFGVDDEPYNCAHPDLKDGKGSENCFHSPSFHWVAEFTNFGFMDFIAVSYAGGIDKFYTYWEPKSVDMGGRITSVFFQGRSPLTVPGYNFLKAVGNHFGNNSIKSMNFTYKNYKRSIVFNGMGKGDGVGMCLFGCDGLAKKGEKAENILSFYYPGTQLETVDK